MSDYTLYKAISPSLKCYIGITKQGIHTRRLQHESCARKGVRAYIFSKALIKYNFNFTWVELASGLTKAQAEELEILTIKVLNATDREFGYNQAVGGLAGDIMTEESKMKRNNSMRKHYDNPEYIKKLSLITKTRLQNEPNSSERQSLNTKAYYSNSENVEKNKAHLKSLRENKEYNIIKARKKGGKQFRCINTGEVFETLGCAAVKLCSNRNYATAKKCICSVLKKKRPTYNGYRFEYTNTP